MPYNSECSTVSSVLPTLCLPVTLTTGDFSPKSSWSTGSDRSSGEVGQVQAVVVLDNL